MRILFVDDEPKVLDGLRRAFYQQRSKWELSFAIGGEAALEEVKDRQFDVIVSDLRMPVIDGLTLLKRVKEQHPETIRIALSGQADQASETNERDDKKVFRLEAVVHQYLSKPCSPSEIQQVIERVLMLKKLLGNEALQRLIGEINVLPMLPQNYQESFAALEKPGVGAAELASLIERDQALCAKLLKIAHSAFFGLPQKTSDLRTVVAYLGFNTIKSILMSTMISLSFEKDLRKREGFLEGIQEHSLLVASLAKKIASANKDEAFIAGLLHDIGGLIIATRLPVQLAELERRKEGYLHPDPELEREILGTSHAEIGAYLLGIWGLPAAVVDAVALHHEPWSSPHGEFNHADAVYLASKLALIQMSRSPEETTEHARRIDREYLRSVGFKEELPS